MTLYEIDQQIIKAIELGYDPETGEILDTSALEELKMERSEKIENICLVIKDLRAETAAIKAERDALDSRMRTSTRKADWLSNYLQNMLAGEKFKTAKCAVSYRKSETVEFTDQDLVPDEYWRVKTTREPDKTALKTALKAGESIPGAYLEQHQNMSIK